MPHSASIPRPTIARTARFDVAICYGTRPQVIKVARLIPALRDAWRVLTIDTGQHYDYALSEAHYRDLSVPAPTVALNVGAAHPVEQSAWIAAGCTRALERHQPRAVVVIGDTNSTLACAVAAAELGLPVVHVEAGLRSERPEMAEEHNRRAVDGLSSVLCAPSAAAVRNLEREGRTGTIVETGDISLDVLTVAAGRAPVRADVPDLPPGPFVLATLHRAELTDDATLLAGVLQALGTLPYPVVLPLHPRTRTRMTQFGLTRCLAPNIRVIAPLPYLATLTALRCALAVVTDSGGVQREAYWLGVPCVTLRGETEWAETVLLGANRLLAPAGAERGLVSAVEEAVNSPKSWSREAYGSGDAASRIRDAIAPLLAQPASMGRPALAR